MSKRVLVVAPHPDDETLGCGGTLLWHKKRGDSLHWLIMSRMAPELGFSADRIALRDQEIKKVESLYGFESLHKAPFLTTKLDTYPASELVGEVSAVFGQVKPEIVYCPFSGDIHTDHRAVFDSVAASTKWFRYPSVERVLVYETPSETEFALGVDGKDFKPNVFVDVSEHLDRKLEIMRVYASELGKFPFPRSEEAIRALAAVRGSASGSTAAEAFMLLKEILK